MTKSTETAAVGRPRRFDDETERQLLIAAAISVMERNDYNDMSVNEILAEAGLSTRAFYRHYDSKEALLETFLLHEAESVGRSLERATTTAKTPPAAVEAWIDRFLDVFFVPRRAKRANMLAAAAARTFGPSAETVSRLRDIACRPLIETLHSGHDTGALYSPRPEADAHSIHDLVMASVSASDKDKVDRETAKAHVLRYAWPALRLISSR